MQNEGLVLAFFLTSWRQDVEQVDIQFLAQTD
jgi:hypothetical protein